MVQRLSFDAHGKRRLADWTAGDPAAPDAETPRGFTGHEHLDSVGLIHMNGRVYDPALGRFLSADPFVPNPTATQSFNRYTYVYNNPLSYTDPTGFWGEMDGYGGDSGGRDGGFASPDFGSGSSGSSSPSASPGDDNIGADSDRSFLDRLQDFLDSPFGKSVGGIVGGFATGAGMAATGGAVALGVGSAIAEAVDYDVPNTQQHSQYGDEYGGPTRDGAHGIQVASFDRFSSVGFDGPVSQLPLLSRPDVQERLSSLGIVALGIASADTPAPGPADVVGGIVFGVGAAIILMQAALTSDQANTQSTTNEEDDTILTFYRGTTLGSALEIVEGLPNGFDIDRIIQNQLLERSEARGVFVTSQFNTALEFARVAGAYGRGLGPAVVRIEVPRRRFLNFARKYGIAVEAPMPQARGRTETLLPFESLPEFASFARFSLVEDLN